jgi:hypothetical protein
LHVVDLVGMHSLAPTHTAAAAPATDGATPPEAARRVVAQQLLAFSRVLAELAAPPPSTCARRVLCAARNSKCGPLISALALTHPCVADGTASPSYHVFAIESGVYAAPLNPAG